MTATIIIIQIAAGLATALVVAAICTQLGRRMGVA